MVRWLHAVAGITIAAALAPVTPAEPPRGISAHVVPVDLREVEPIYQMTPEAARLLPSLELPPLPPPEPPPWLREGGAPTVAREPRPMSLLTPGTAEVSFDSFDWFDSGAVPPDPSGAAGLNHVVNVVRSNFAFYDKSGGLENSGTLQEFFAPLAHTATFNPKVLYDTFADRFVLIALDAWQSGTTLFSQILVAVSDDGNPNGTWHEALINSLTNIGGKDRFADSPGLAVDEDNIYITANMLSLSGQFANSRIWRIGKDVGIGGFYDGGTAAVTVMAAPVPPPPNDNPVLNYALQPTHMLGLHPNSAAGTFFTTYNGLHTGSNEVLSLYTMTDPAGTPTFTHEFIELGNIDNTFAGVPEPPQNASVFPGIYAGDRRVSSSVWRNDKLYLATTVVPSGILNGGQATAHWIQLDTTTLFTTAVVGQGHIGGEDIAPGTHTFYPAITVSAADVVGLGFSASGTSIFPGAYFTLRLSTDPPGTVRPSQTVAAGIDRYIATPDGVNWWGAYSGLALDPSNDCFWAYNEYSLTQQPPPAPPNNNGVWGTRWAAFCVDAECGNSIVEPGETCDPPGLTVGQPGECRWDCFYCGDHVLHGDAGETCDDGNNLPGDGCTSTCELCTGPNPFSQALLALDPATFIWTSPADIDFARGDLALISTYATLATGSATFATQLPVPEQPEPGAGFYFVVRTDCPGATWSSGGSGECKPPSACPPGGRDGNLPPVLP